MVRLSTTKNLDAAEAVALTTHRSSDGKNHADVVTNTADITGGKGPGVITITDAGATADQTYNAFIAPAAGAITAVYAKLGTACGGAEVVDLDVQIAGVTALNALLNFAAGDGTGSKAATLAAAPAQEFAAGELVTVVIDQTTGGADTAADMVITVAWRLT